MGTLRFGGSATLRASSDTLRDDSVARGAAPSSAGLRASSACGLSHTERNSARAKRDMLVTLSHEFRSLQRASNRGKSTADVLATALKCVRTLVDAERGTVYLIDERSRELFTTVAEGIDSERTIRVPISSASIAGHVAMTGVTVNTADAYSDKRFDQRTDLRTGFRTRGMLTMPILKRMQGGVRPRVVGVVQMVNKVGGASFSRDDVERLSDFGTHLALALSALARFQSGASRLTKVVTAARAFSPGRGLAPVGGWGKGKGKQAQSSSAKKGKKRKALTSAAKSVRSSAAKVAAKPKRKQKRRRK